MRQTRFIRNKKPPVTLSSSTFGSWKILLYNTEAVVVKTVRYGETHAIVTLLTPIGRVSAMARSAMKPQSRLAAGIRLCAEGTYSIYQGKGMGTISQVEVVASRRRLHEDLESAAYAAYFCELILHSAPERPDGDPAMYRQFTALLDALVDRPSDSEVLARVWETKMSRWLGVSPEWTTCIRCNEPLTPAVRYHTREGGLICGKCTLFTDISLSFPVPESMGKILYLFERTSIDKLGHIQISVATRRALKQTLYYQLSDFAGLYLKSRHILDQLAETFGTDNGGDPI
ncbi:DNA repair protein RecO [Alicyclobacillus dauci]|uniref:DNA repair protein RecO n=1 Tax=Alicyclobacillus dauci TaxID=1475485 RepID=A0ABY6Z7P8_9BACL|nr:DNA repair protein RecO [Alicyclobacillus dauci]WAH38553.1 DNA repair protein RecO [Alicyclobacillus dauci]